MRTLPKVLQEGLVLWLDSNGKDLSWNGNNGTLVNTPTKIRRLQNDGLSYNGSSQSITFPNINSITGFSAWIYPTANTKTILTISSGNTINLSASNTITFTWISGWVVYVNWTSTNNIQLNKWNHIRCNFTSINSSSGSIATSSFVWGIINPRLYTTTQTQKEAELDFISTFIK